MPLQDSFDFLERAPAADLVRPPVTATGIAARIGRRKPRLLPCQVEFVQAVTALCARSGQTPSRLLNAALLLWEAAGRPALPDPGPPTARVASIAHGAAKRPRGRWPGLAVRLPAGIEPAEARAVLGFALSLAGAGPLRLVTTGEIEGARANLAASLQQRDRVLTAFERLAFPIPDHPVGTPGEAARLLGFANEFGLDVDRVNARFRDLSFVYHPDQGVPDKGWFKHLAAAREVLLRALRR